MGHHLDGRNDVILLVVKIVGNMCFGCGDAYPGYHELVSVNGHSPPMQERSIKLPPNAGLALV